VTLIDPSLFNGTIEIVEALVKSRQVWQSPRTLGRTYSRVHHD